MHGYRPYLVMIDTKTTSFSEPARHEVIALWISIDNKLDQLVKQKTEINEFRNA